MIRLGARDKRAIVILGSAVVLYAVVSWVVLPAYDTLAGAEVAAMERETLLQKYRQAAGRRGRYEGLLARVASQQAQAETRVIKAASFPLAAAEFQSYIEGTAQKLGIGLSQRAVATPPASNEALRELTMSVAFEGTPQQTVSFLAEVRALPKSVRVLTLTVNPLQVAQEPPKGTPFSKNLRVVSTLGALMQLEAAAPAPSRGGN